MKYIIYISLFICFGCTLNAQQTWPSGIPTQFSTGFFRHGYDKSDSGTIVALRDTTWFPKFSGTIVFRPQTRLPYYYDSTALRWYPMITSPSDSSFYYIDYIPQTTNPSYSEGRLFYDNANKTLTLFDAIQGTSLQIGQEEYVRARNNTGSQINDGSVVYFSGSTGQTPTIGLARSNNVVTSRVIGIATHNIANNTVGKVTTFGLVNDINTSSFSAGDKLYLSPTTPGALTNVQPDVPNFSVFIGYCLNSHVTQGKLLIDPQKTLISISQLTDTSFIARIDGISDTIRIRVSGGSGGTVTSVGLSMPSAFNVSGSPITGAGTLAVSGAGTTLQYIRGNGTLATFDTAAISNFYLKVRGLLSGTSPITYNTTTGAIGIQNATASGTKGAATFDNSYFTDNGSGTISLADLVSAGACINCQLSIDQKGRITSYSDGNELAIYNASGAGDTLVIGDDTVKRLNFSYGLISTPTASNITVKVDTSAIATQYDLTQINFTNSNIGSGYRWVVPNTNNIKTVFASNTILWDSTSNSNALTAKADTSVLATQYDLTLVGNPATPLNSIQYNNAGSFGGDSLQYYPSQKKILTSQDYFQYGRPVRGFFQDSAWNFTTGKLWMVYPRGSGGTGADTLQPFYGAMDNTLYDVTQPENPVYTLLSFGAHGDTKPYASIRLEQSYYNHTEYHAFVTKSRNMPNPNNETRNWSWFVSQLDGSANLTTRSSDNRWNLSIENSPYYDREYAVLDPSHFKLQAINNPGVIGCYAGYLQQWYMAMNVDTASGGTATLAAGGVGQLNIGSDIDLIIPSPGVATGVIQSKKHFYVDGKQVRLFNLANSTTAFGVASSSQGLVFQANTDASGFADVNVIGKQFINKDNAISASDRMFGIYNHYNTNDSIFHVRGNGNLWTKGLVNIQTLKTTVTAPATEGTTKMVICDTNGLLSYTDLPVAATTLYTGDGTVSGNRDVDLNNLNLTFSDVNTFRINYDAYVQAKADGTFPYTSAIVAPAQQLWIGYTPTAGTFSKGSGIAIDTNNNVAIGTSTPPTTAPLYADGAAYLHGLQSGRGNFYRVSDFSADHTMTNAEYWANIDASGGNVTITLPAASSVFGSSMGIHYVFRRVDNTLANTVTISRSGSDTINGATSTTLTAQYEVKEIGAVSTSAWAIK
jgi:hypothetical protein